MSGPKTSEYTLTAEQRANLLAQNRCDSSIIACIGQMDGIFSQVNIALGEIELFEGAGGDGNKIKTQELKKQIQNIENIKNQLQSRFAKVSSYKASTATIPSQDALAKKEAMLQSVKKIKDETEDLIKEASTLRKTSIKIHSDISAEIEENLHSSFDLSWDLAVKTSETNQKKEANIAHKKEAIISSVKMLLEMDVPPLLREKVYKALATIKQIESEEFLRNFSAVSIKPLEDECKHYIALKEKCGEQFDDLNSRYISLCNMIGTKHKLFTLSEESCNQLKKEIALLEEELCDAQEEEYIAEAIDEVMEEMGYDLIGRREVTKKSGKRFRDELYTFSEGTAVNIRYDNQGKIAMELGGIDSTDRLPSSSEASRLEDEMVAFCDKFTEFEKRLAQRGIVCKSRISHLPPKAEYAQIINTSDYDMKTEVETFKTERRSAKNESKKAKSL